MFSDICRIKQTFMETFLEILKYILPSLVVLVTAFIVIRSFLENDLQKREKLTHDAAFNAVLPMKIQAYERAVLFIERITPPNLVMRISKAGMTPEQLQGAMINSVREEFEHNMSQQLFLTDIAWNELMKAREYTQKLINSAIAELKENDGSQALVANLIRVYLQQKEDLFKEAIRIVKAEFEKDVLKK